MKLNRKNSVNQLPSIVTRVKYWNNFLFIIKRNILVLILISIFILGIFLSKYFLSLANLQNVAIYISMTGILAIGQTIVMLTRQLDLSLGAQMALTPMASIVLAKIIMSKFGVQIVQGTNYLTSGTLMIIVFIFIISFLIGLINGIICVKAKVPAFIATLGMLYALRGTAYVISHGYPYYFTRLKGFGWLGYYKLFNIPVCFLIFLVIGIIGILTFKYTKIGSIIYSIGSNEKAATYSGINPNFWKIAVFTISGFCAGVAGFIYSSRLESVEVTQASGYEFLALAIAVIGGTTLEGGRGNISGTIIGAIIMGVVINIINLIGLVVWYQTIIIGVIIILAVFAYLRKTKISKIE